MTKFKILFLTCLALLLLTGCVTKEQQAFLDDPETKKEAVRLVREALNEQGIEKADISDDLRYANSGKSKLSSIIEVDYTLNYSFEFKSRARIDVKNNENGKKKQLGKVTENGLAKTNSQVGIESELMFELQAMSLEDELYQKIHSGFLKRHPELELGWLNSGRKSSGTNLDKAIKYYKKDKLDKVEARDVINEIAAPVFATANHGYELANMQKFNLTFRQVEPWTEENERQLLKELTAIRDLEPGEYEILLDSKDAEDTFVKTGFYVKPNEIIEPSYYSPSDEKEMWINWYK
ncbi:hypothetical protein [Paenilisteria newyorkensis]|uniref:hypothetical protein n=1 Tax=Listeria newyorkensis TaxID=1497681 RepID=UPI000669CF82|nr:hypothetical protein [Listeria newyorkensis]KMT63018.1 hypothetical protein X559_0660 [Listeria newyorkensis]